MTRRDPVQTASAPVRAAIGAAATATQRSVAGTYAAPSLRISDSAVSGASGGRTVAPPHTTSRSPAQETTALSRGPSGEAGSFRQALVEGFQAAPSARKSWSA